MARSVERLQDEIGRLVAERQALRERDASGNDLESNRVRLATSQRDLSLALIDRYLPRAERDAA